MSLKIENTDAYLSSAVDMRNSGRFSEADHIFNLILSSNNVCPSVYYEYAFSKRLQGDHIEAVKLLKIAQRQFSRDEKISSFLIHMLYSCGLHVEAFEELLFCNASMNFNGNVLELLKEFGEYISEWTRERALYCLDSIYHEYGLLNVNEVTNMILDAVDNKKPFSLIRLGDGEGSCISFGVSEENRFSRLLSNARKELNYMWFGDKLTEEEYVQFTSLSRNIIPISFGSDIVGLPYPGWIKHEYKISSLRGIPCLMNIVRSFYISKNRISTKPKVCTQLIHIELYKSGNLEVIIRKCKKISIITCLGDLPEKLKKIFDLDEVDFYPIPGENGSSSILGNEISYENHFPKRYEKLLSELNKPHDGRLFLVAAGILGKFYSSVIKDNGGIALDIGSIVDGWVNKYTRPGMSEDMSLKSVHK